MLHPASRNMGPIIIYMPHGKCPEPGRLKGEPGNLKNTQKEMSIVPGVLIRLLSLYVIS